MNIGNLTLLISLITGFFSLVLSIFKKNKISSCLLYASIFFLCSAFLILIYHFIADNFTNFYVYTHSAQKLPLYYKLSALWAGQQGSLMLWLIFFSLLAIIFILKNKTANKSIIIIYLYILILVIIATPFIFTPETPIDGKGLNPILKNIWMISHPPLLFLGYSLAVFPYIFTLKTLSSLNYKYFIEKSHSWIITAALFVGLGIFTGSYWAYSTMGWGGYWSWDPVENSSLIPWLLLIILLHSVSIQKKYQKYNLFNFILTIIILVCVVTGTYLTRSGILDNYSTHSFIKSTITEYLLLAIILIITTPILILVKNKDLKKNISKNDQSLPFHIQNFLQPALISLLLYTALIFIATIFPILSKLFTDQTYSIHSNFYNALSWPFSICFLLTLLLAANPTLFKLKNITKTGIIFCLAIAFSYLININYSFKLSTYLICFLLFINLFASIYTLKRENSLKNYPKFLSHNGLIILILGIVLSSAHSSEFNIQCFGNKITKTKYGNFQYIKINTDAKEQEDKFSIIYSQNKFVSKRQFTIKNNQIITPEVSEWIIHNFLYDLHLQPESLLKNNAKNSSSAVITINLLKKKLIILIWTGLILISSGLFFQFTIIIYENYKLNQREKNSKV